MKARGKIANSAVTTQKLANSGNALQVMLMISDGFPQDSDYFGSRTNSFMVNFRVADLDAMLAQLRAGGCDVVDKIERSAYGQFGWVTDPDGNRVELWQPPDELPPD